MNFVYVPKALTLMSNQPNYDLHKDIFTFLIKNILEKNEIIKIPFKYFSEFEKIIENFRECEINSRWESHYKDIKIDLQFKLNNENSLNI